MLDNARNVQARVASKNRRDKEGTEIQLLAESLPFSHEERKNLEKEAVVRLVIAYFRLRQLMLEERGQAAIATDTAARLTTTTTPCLPPPFPGPLPLPPPPQQRCAPALPSANVTSRAEWDYQRGPGYNQTQSWTARDTVNAVASQGAPVVTSAAWTTCGGINEGELLLAALQGFLILINKKGRVLYVSSNVEEYLGISQSWLLGRPVSDCLHPEDVKELALQLELPAHGTAIFPQPLDRNSTNSYGYSFKTERDFYLRMLQYPNGVGSRKKPGNFVVVHWSGQVRVSPGWSHVRGGRPRARGLVCVCRPVQSNSVLHLRLGGNMFISRHDMRLTYTYCDPRVLFLIGYDPASLLGRTVYQFHNPVDAHKCSECHSTLIKSGTGVSKYYRFLGSTGVWVWMQTRATIVSDTRGKPQYVVCNNYIISQKEGDRSHMMEQQQQLQQALPASDLTAKGVIDLVTLPPVTSPTSISSVDDDHDDVSYSHDDTGYNTAVSSISSDCTSPAGVGGLGGDLDAVLSPPDLQLTSDCHTESVKYAQKSGKGLYADNSETRLYTENSAGLFGAVPSLVTGQEYRSQDLTVSLPSPLGSLQDSGMVSEAGEVSEGCSADLSTNLSSEESDPFLYSAGSAPVCGEGTSNVMEDMELLEDLLERITDCDKPESTRSVSMELTHNDGEEETETLFGSSLSMASHPGPKEGSEEGSATPQVSGEQYHKPLSLLRTLLDREGQAIIERPPAPILVTKTSTSESVNDMKSCANGSERTAQLHKDKRRRSFDQARMRFVQKQGRLTRSLSDTVDLTDEDTEESGDEMIGFPTALPDDLLDFAMQYCDSFPDMDPILPDADVWHSNMDDLIDTDSQIPESLASGEISGARNTVSDQVSRKVVMSKCSSSTPSESKHTLNCTVGFGPSTTVPSTAISSTARKDCMGSVDSSVKPVKSMTVQPVTKPPGVASMLSHPVHAAAGTINNTDGSMHKGVKPHTPQPSVPSPVCGKVAFPASCRVLSPVLIDHRYFSARTPSPHSKAGSPGGKRLCVESDRPHPGRGTSVAAQSPRPQPKSPSQDSTRTCHTPGSTLTGKVIIASPGKNPNVMTNKTTVTVGQKILTTGSLSHSPGPISPTLVPVPANGGGKPLTAMSELEKHLRGLAPPMEHRNELEDTLTPVGECGDTASSRPFLERLLTGEISHERYRQIDYHLLYQERERRLSETCSPPSSCSPQSTYSPQSS